MNNKLISKKILFFPDKICGEDSGARSARFTLKSLIELGYKVAVYTSDADKMKNEEIQGSLYFYQINSLMRADSHFFDSKLLNQFRNIIREFQPEYFFTAGSIQKPSILAKEARKLGIKTIFLFYITDYYCIKTYAGLNDGPCFKCIENGPFQAWNNKCIKDSPKLINLIKGIAVRSRIQFELRRCYKVAGYSEDQLNIYKKIGVTKEKCAKINFQFDSSELDNIIANDGDYFLLYGQPSVEKGWHTLSKIIPLLKTKVKFKIIFFTKEIEALMLKKFELINFVLDGTIVTEIAVNKREDIIEQVAKSKAVLIPSYYPTTGEFVLLESLIIGKPVLVFETGSHNDIIIHGVNGMSAQINDFKKFANNIDIINTNEKLRKNITYNAKKTATEMFSKSKRIESLTNLFN